METFHRMEMNENLKLPSVYLLLSSYTKGPVSVIKSDWFLFASHVLFKWNFPKHERELKCEEKGNAVH